MKKRIWIFNHYASDTYFDNGGRHFWIAQNLIDQGYDVTIFCSNVVHNSDKVVEIENDNYTVKDNNGIKYVFVKTTKYKKNDFYRIKNMFDYYIRLINIAKKNYSIFNLPDIIYSSSVHPLALVAGIKLSKLFKVPSICEVRDLWPESIIAYGYLREKSFIAKLLYMGEKWIYRKADAIIMTWEGGKQYIKDKGWDKDIELKKINYIGNGLVINSFDNNANDYVYIDKDLQNRNYKNIVYTGSIRKVNNIGFLLDVAKILMKKNNRIRFLIYGAGDEKNMLESRCKLERINNVIFKGRVEKKMVPSILKQSYANILHNSSTSLDKYGQSQNKFFEYLAAGRCIIQTYTTGYSILDSNNCGVSAYNQNSKEVAEIIFEMCKDDEKVEQMGNNARKTSYNFDFTKLTNKLIKVIENV